MRVTWLGAEAVADSAEAVADVLADDVFLLGSCLAGTEAVADLADVPRERYGRLYNLFSEKDGTVEWAHLLRRSPAAGRKGFDADALRRAGLTERVRNVDCSAFVDCHAAWGPWPGRPWLSRETMRRVLREMNTARPPAAEGTGP